MSTATCFGYRAPSSGRTKTNTNPTPIQVLIALTVIMESPHFECDQYLDGHVGFVLLRFSRLTEDGTPVTKHVGVDTMHCIVLYFI